MPRWVEMEIVLTTGRFVSVKVREADDEQM